jgi:hypothetical protein
MMMIFFSLDRVIIRDHDEYPKSTFKAIFSFRYGRNEGEGAGNHVERSKRKGDHIYLAPKKPNF